MSDQQQAAADGGDGQNAVQPQQGGEPRVYTEADLEEMRLKGDKEGMRKAVEQLTRIAQGEEPLPEPDAGQSPDGNQQGQPPAPQKKTFDIKFRGGDKSFDDSDGYLGTGDFGRMKKELAHNRAKLGDVEEQYLRASSSMEEANQRYRSLQEQKEAAESRVKDLEARVRELELKLTQAESSRPAQQPQPQQQPQGAVQQPQKLEIPDPPEPPELPDDPFDWTPDHRAADAKYRKTRAAYDRSVAEIMKKLLNGGIQQQPQQQIPPQPQPRAPQQAAPKPQSDLPPEVREAVEYFRTHKQAQARELAQSNMKAYWDSFRDFQSKHEEFKTPTDIEELNKSVLLWMDKLAYANGFDLKPGASDAERSQYESVKRQLAFKYAKGDAQVLANSEGCPAPAGYDIYVRLANLDKIRKTITKPDVPASEGMHLAWLKTYSENGMNEDISRLQASAANKAAGGVLSALERHQREHAVNLPNNIPGGGAPPNSSQLENITDAEINSLLSASPLELATNPAMAEKRRKVLAAISETAGAQSRR